jgi:hypothetical protein
MSSFSFEWATKCVDKWRFNNDGDSRSRSNKAELGQFLCSERSLGHNSETRTANNFGTISNGVDPILCRGDIQRCQRMSLNLARHTIFLSRCSAHED